MSNKQARVKSLAIATVLTLAPIAACKGPALAPVPEQAVSVVVTCDPTPRARVNPELYGRSLSQPSIWVLNIQEPNSNSIAIVPYADQSENPWPFKGTQYPSDTNGIVVIGPDQFKDDLQPGTYWYRVAYECGGKEYFLDPRMGIHN